PFPPSGCRGDRGNGRPHFDSVSAHGSRAFLPPTVIAPPSRCRGDFRRIAWLGATYGRGSSRHRKRRTDEDPGLHLRHRTFADPTRRRSDRQSAGWLSSAILILCAITRAIPASHEANN